MQPDSMVVQLSDLSEKVEEFATLLQSFGIIELARTGMVALARSSRPTA
jgi:acetolactate synthase-1/3 small subunit